MPRPLYGTPQPTLRHHAHRRIAGMTEHCNCESQQQMTHPNAGERVIQVFEMKTRPLLVKRPQGDC